MLNKLILGFIAISMFASCKENKETDTGMEAMENHQGHNHDAQDHSAANASDQPYIASTAEEMPRFPGCEEMDVTPTERNLCSFNLLMAYIKDHMVYPASAKNAKIEGVVGAQFVVDEKGMINNIEIVKSLDKSCDQAVIDVLKSMNSMSTKWRAGVNGGKPIPVRMQVPVRFKLDSPM